MADGPDFEKRHGGWAPPTPPGDAPSQSPPGGWAPPPVGQPDAAGSRTPRGRPLSGWWARVGASLLDSLILAPITVGLLLAFNPDTFDADQPLFSADDVLGQLAGAIVYVVYGFVTMRRWDGQTLGKRIVGIRAVRADGGTLTSGQILGRQGFQVLGGLLVLLALLDYLWPLWDRENRAIHDLVVDSRVISA